MAIELSNVSSGYSTGVINDNFQAIEAYINDNLLNRDGTSTGEANQLELSLDMNSNFIFNLPEPTLEHQAARLKDVQNAINGADQANLITFTPYGNISSENVQGAIQEIVDGTGQSVTTSTGTDQTLAEALDARAIHVNSVSEIPSLVTAAMPNGQIIAIRGYHAGSDTGGGFVYYDSSRPKSDHNGGTILSPTVPWSTNLTDYLSGAGETDPSGSGVFVKIPKESLDPSEFGLKTTSSVYDTDIFEAFLAQASGYLLGRLPQGGSYTLSDEMVIPERFYLNLNKASVDFQVDGAVKGFVLSDYSAIYNGTVTVTGTNPTGGGDNQSPISGGNQSTGVGVVGCRVGSVNVNTNRSNGNGVVFFGDSRNCTVEGIHGMDSSTMGRVVAFEWGGSDAGGTGHPHNNEIKHISAGNITFGATAGSDAYVVWLSSAFNTKVDNVFAESVFGLVGVFAGDKSNDFAPAEYKDLVGRGITIDNVSCEDIKWYGVRVYGKGASSTNLLPQSVVITNPTLRADGTRTNTVGVVAEFTNGVRVVNPDISGMNNGIATGQDTKNLGVIGGKAWGNRNAGVTFGSGAGGVDGCFVDGTYIYNNNTSGSVGSTTAAAVLLANCTGWRVANCRFGLSSGETQQYSVRIEATATGGHLENNHTFGLAASGAAYVNSSSTDYAVGTTGGNNTAESGLTGFGGAPVYRINWLGRKEFVINGASAPGSGTWQAGDRAYYSAPVAGGFVGSVYTGTAWKGFGQLEA